MPQQGIDYAKLAAQAGGRPSGGRGGGAGPAGRDGTPPIDYAALARQAGGSPQEPGEAEPKQQEQSGMQRAANAFLKYVPNPLGIAKGIRGAIRTVTDPAAMPTVGAIGGGIVGGLIGNVPGAIAGAGIGGGLGKGSELMARDARGEDVPQTAGWVFGEMAKRGASEAALQAGGGVVAKGARIVAKPLYNLGLGAKMSLRKEYPDLVKTGIEEGIPVTRRGAEKAGRLRTVSRERADAMVARAEASGAGPVTSNDVVGGAGLPDIAASARNRALGGTADESAAVATRAKTIHMRNRGGVPLTKAQQVKRDLQDKAERAYRAAERGGTPATIDDELNRAAAQGFQRAIETKVPGVRAVSQRTQSLGGLTQALEDAGDKNQFMRMLLFPAATGMTSGFSTGDVGTGTTAALSTAALTAPGNLSRAAIGLDRFGKWNFPVHAVRAAILAQLAGQEEFEK